MDHLYPRIALVVQIVSVKTERYIQSAGGSLRENHTGFERAACPKSGCDQAVSYGGRNNYETSCTICGAVYQRYYSCSSGHLYYTLNNLPSGNACNKSTSSSNCTTCGGDGLVDTRINCKHNKGSTHQYCSHEKTSQHDD